MFRPFHHRSFEPAWAAEGPGNPFMMSGRHEHKGSGGGWGDETRTRRGDIKFILLELLSEHPQHGYELMKELEARRGGFHRPSPGSVYPTLQMLEENGYLTREEVEGKRVYTITESGRQFLSDRPEPPAKADRHPHPETGHPHDRFTEDKPSELIELRRTLTEVNDAVTQFARSGNLEQASQVRDLLVHVKREIYKLLSEQ
jgi:DNA-binding PadR family transcriptional regulator